MYFIHKTHFIYYILFCLQIVFEGVVGENNLGDIAIDDITVIQGACPSEC